MSIEQTLVKEGWAFLKAPKLPKIHFLEHPEANDLLNNLNLPHAFVLACCMDRQIDAARAWMIPFFVQEKLNGDFSIEKLGKITISRYKRWFEQGNWHRYNDKMAEVFYRAVHHIIDEYGGDASKIWMGKPKSAIVVARFLDFFGVGVKIATMAANILARDFKIPYADLSAIDVSPDTHIKRVMARMGLINHSASIEKFMYVARGICPEYPGVIDSSLWKLGRGSCAAQKPACDKCDFAKECPKNIQKDVV